MRRLVLASKNPGKLREIREALGELPLAVAGLEEFDEVAEPAEDGATFADNARAKALYYARATGQWCLADDSGLVVDALGGAPGVLSARYALEDCPPDADRQTIDRANNAKLLAALREVPPPRRTGRFVCHLALAAGDRIEIEAADAVEGRIGYEPHGTNGFGYDPLFHIPQFGCTTAELSSEQKNQVSHRGKAVRAFVQRLREYLRESGG